MSKSRFVPEAKAKAVEEFLNGIKSVSTIARELPIGSEQTVRDWSSMYRNYGVLAFGIKYKNNSYSKEFKTKVVEEYLAGLGSLTELSARYNLRSHKTLRRWIIMYNSCIELKDYAPRQEVYMTEARRKTT